MCGDSWQKAWKEVPVFASSSSALWAHLTPCLVPFMFSVSGDSGLQAPCPSPGPSRKWLCQLLSGGPGEEGRDRDSEKTGNQGPTEPQGRTPALGTPQSPPRGRRPHLCSLDSAFPGWVPRLAESRGSWRSGWHLETSCRFLSAQSLSFPLSRPPGVRFHPLPRQGSRERTRALPGALMTRLGGGHAEISRDRKPASPQVWLGVGGQSVRIMRAWYQNLNLKSCDHSRGKKPQKYIEMTLFRLLK